jgi:hypothetical protein
MENVVPVTLQRLRAADIIRMAGLAAAAVGQEYYRSGAVHSMSRRGALLLGIVELSPLHAQANDDTLPKMGSQRFSVEVEFVGAGLAPALPTDQRAIGTGLAPALPTDHGTIGTGLAPALSADQRAVGAGLAPALSAPSWLSKCSCSSDAHSKNGPALARPLLCTHGAALLYQWLAQPSLFQTQDASSAVGKGQTQGQPLQSPISTAEQMESPMQRQSPRGGTAGEGPAPVSAVTENLIPLLSELSLSELRGVAREYGLVVSSIPRQQLAESIQAELRKPDVIRRIAATLEKSQRQLLAVLILAGGAVSDDDLRGLFERFSLGQPSQLQHILLTLQGKALLFRTSLNASNITQRPHHGLLNSSLLDSGWYVPLEVRNALRVPVPITPFDVQNTDGRSGPMSIHQAEPSGPLAMLLLVTRWLAGYNPAAYEMWYERSELKRPLEVGWGSRGDPLRSPSPYIAPASGLPSSDGSVAMPSPEDLPSSSLLQELQERILGKEGADPAGQFPSESRSAFLRFIMRVLGVADLLYKGGGQSPTLSLRAGAAERLLGPNWTKTLRTLFKLWLTQTSFGDLYDLTEEGIRLRCRATSQHQPVLHSGDLEAENSQARQYIVALLAQAPLNQWINFSSFARFVYRLSPLFLQRRYQWGRATTSSMPPQWWLELEEGRPLRPLQLGDWLRAEFVYLRHMIAGPLHWWGACDIVTSADGNVQAFRLTPMASWLFNGNLGQGTVGAGLAPAQPLRLEEELQEDDYPQYVAPLDVRDASEILITCSVQNWPVIQLLELFTEPAGVRQGEEQAQPLLAYRISAEVFGLALGRGLRPFVLLRLLRLAAEMKADVDIKRAQLFTQIATQFEQWLVGYSRVRLYTGVTLLETVDAAVMREVVATTSLEEALVQNIHSTLCIVKSHRIGHIVDELKQRGQSPLLHDEDL